MEEDLVVVKRGPYTESKHRGHIAVMDATGKLLYSVGDPKRLTFTRSALKPVQAIPLVQSGAAERFLMSDREIAICCGSHNGEEMHVDTVRGMLHRLGLDESALQCGSHLPYDPQSAENLLRGGGQACTVHNNCSGKHAGMLALAKFLQSDIEAYHLPEHPVQRMIAGTLCEVTGLSADSLAVAIDGCGVPTYGMGLDRMALIYARFARPEGLESNQLRLAVSRIVKAMTAHPEMVAGREVLCTDLMRVASGDLVAKAGAEGVYGVGLPREGLGIAVKVEDGNIRAAFPAVMETLRQLGALSDERQAALASYHTPTLRNRAHTPVGTIEPVFTLRAAVV
ncbi:L-asparaginase [Paenibacillus swuensis]|uniref:L-asparaginase n=1 Tax=Paenibacillus swuensis TaxID=1178515 RepID=A0A172TE02_9BACL|nr:asparaginase [Paenibacillus swuensis]ANE45166.1 L-asparaginase [Paenibacillus swuensis]